MVELPQVPCLDYKQQASLEKDKRMETDWKIPNPNEFKCVAVYKISPLRNSVNSRHIDKKLLSRYNKIPDTILDH